MRGTVLLTLLAGCYPGPAPSQPQKMIASVRKATGLVESSFQGCYAGREFDVPVIR
jgi:hypothetical protein